MMKMLMTIKTPEENLENMPKILPETIKSKKRKIVIFINEPALLKRWLWASV